VVTAPDGTPALRRRIERIAVHDRFAASRFTDGAVRVTTASIVDGACEVRVHAVDAPAGHRVRDGGHPLAGDEPPVSDVTATATAVRRTDGLNSVVRALHGFTSAGVDRAADASAFGPFVATPFVAADHPGGTAVYASLVVLTGAAPDTGVSALVDGAEITVNLPGGDTVVVRLDDRPSYRRTLAHGRVVSWTPEGARVDTPTGRRGGSV
jgi:hypothetical protein